MELTRLLDDPLPKSDLICEAFNCLKNAWVSVMAYRNNGRHCIDNSIAERSIRTMAIECKNKIDFDSHQGAETSTVYYTFTATFRMGALSFYQSKITDFYLCHTCKCQRIKDFEITNVEIGRLPMNGKKLSFLFLKSLCFSVKSRMKGGLQAQN